MTSIRQYHHRKKLMGFWTARERHGFPGSVVERAYPHQRITIYKDIEEEKNKIKNYLVDFLCARRVDFTKASTRLLLFSRTLRAATPASDRAMSIHYRVLFFLALAL